MTLSLFALDLATFFGNDRCLYYEIFHTVNILYEHNIIVFVRLHAVVLKVYLNSA